MQGEHANFNGSFLMENSLTTSQNLKVDVSYDPVILLLDRFLKDLSNFILMLLGFRSYASFMLNALSLKHSSVSTFVSSYISVSAFL